MQRNNDWGCIVALCGYYRGEGGMADNQGGLQQTASIRGEGATINYCDLQEPGGGANIIRELTVLTS